MRKQIRFYRVGYAPFTLIPSPLYTDRREAAERARQENKIGEYRGRGIKVYEVDDSGQIKARS